MKNLNTFEEFLNEASRNKRGNNKINFLKDSTSDVDHTRLVKWMGKNIDSNKYYFEKSKTVGYWILDVKKLSERELKDLLGYLESEKYKFGTQIWLPAYESEMNEGHRPAKVKIPTNASTVIKKIQKENPFKRGKEIADMIEENWSDIIETSKGTEDQRIFREELSKKEYVIDLCKKLNLDDFYFVGQIMKNYF
jgi:hypothetical protein